MELGKVCAGLHITGKAFVSASLSFPMENIPSFAMIASERFKIRTFGNVNSPHFLGMRLYVITCFACGRTLIIDCL